MNFLLGSMRTTSSDGSSIRTYLAAVAPAQPPPTTITRRPVVGMSSDGVVVAVGAPPMLAQPARPETAKAALPDAFRKSLRVIRAMTSPPWNCHGRWTATVRYSGSVGCGEFSGVLVPRRRERPRSGHRHHEQQRRAPADDRRQEHGDAELGERAAESQPRDGRAQREARDGRPQLHLPLARAPDRARAAAAGERHADAEEGAAQEPAHAGGREDPVALVLEVGELEDREAERAHPERQRSRPRVLGVAGHERLAERAHEAEARALEDHAEDGAEEEEDAALRMTEGRVGERRRDQRGEQQHPRERLPARVAAGPRPRTPAAARPARAVRGLPEQIAQAEECPDAEPHHHREAADVAAEREGGAHAHEHAAGGALDELAPGGHADRELPRAQRAGGAAEQHAEVEQRARVEPRRQEVRAA